MNQFKNIEKFNTHSMSDETVLSVVTGRDMLIHNLSAIIRENIMQPGTMQHIVLIGPRGMGKSFLLRYFQIITKRQDATEGFIDFALLPEEQHNINTVAGFIDELLARINNNEYPSKSSLWEVNEESWESSVYKLRSEIEKKKRQYGNYLFIAAVENIDVLLENVFNSKVDESRFRKLLSNTPNFMLFATSLKYDIDNQYNKRLFFAFQKFHIEPWKEDDYLNYFYKRFELLKQQNPEEYNSKDIGLLTNKLKAISRFTGGSPRMAVVLTNLIFNDDAVSIARTLNDIVEDLSPYYQDMMAKMPNRSKILFDTLIREKENISQSELALKVGTHQASISQAFKWLLDNNYLSGHKVSGEKQYRYSVSDRVFVLFYYKRYILNGIQCSYIRILADFLVSFYETGYLIEQNYSELTDYEKTIEDHFKTYDLSELKGNLFEEAGSLGQIDVNQMLNDPNKVFKLLEDKRYLGKSKEQVFKVFCDAVYYKEKQEGKAPAFKLANEILIALKTQDWKLNKFKALSNFFAGLLNMKLSFDLLTDICNETTGMFGNEGDVIIEAVQHCMGYIESGKDNNYLLKLNPDMANAVSEIVAEAKR